MTAEQKKLLKANDFELAFLDMYKKNTKFLRLEVMEIGNQLYYSQVCRFNNLSLSMLNELTKELDRFNKFCIQLEAMAQ